MRKWMFLGLLFCLARASSAQSLNVTLTGQWGQGSCEVIHKRGEYTFVGNGPSLEVYRNKRGVYAKTDAILLPSLVKDIWVRGDLSIAYVACYTAGLQIVQFDALNGLFLGVVGKDASIGPAHGIMQFGNYVYVADGKGLVIFDVSNPYSPSLKSTFATSGFAHDVWVLNDSTVFVAADTAGLYAIRTKNLLAPTYLDSLKFAPAFPGFPVPGPKSTQVIIVDTVAYVAAGWGGMRTASVTNPRNLKPLGVWTYGIPVDVQGVWVSGHFAYLGCGKDGIFCPINVTNPRSPTGPPFNVTTRGNTSDIVVAQDTAYVADGFNGHLIVDVREGFEPAILDSIRMGDVCYDAEIPGQYAYVAAGKMGVKVFDTALLNPTLPPKRIPQAGAFDTPGEARGLKKTGSLMVVADGSAGLTILNVSNPIAPIQTGNVAVGGDTAYQVDVAGSYAALACGRNGLRLIDISGSLFEIGASPVATHGLATDIKVVGQRAYVANGTGVHVYSLSALPAVVSLVDSMPRPAGLALDVRALDVSGDTVFVANGKNGILLWKTTNDLILTQNIDGVCTDLSIREKTIYASDDENGLRIYDASSAGELHEVGYYRNSGNALGLGVSQADGKVFLADGTRGFQAFNTFIQPKIVVTPGRLNFGPVPPDYTRTLPLLIQNTGTSLLNVTGIQTITNTKKNEFRFSEIRFSVAAGDTHRITVRFEPNMLTFPFDVIGSTQIRSNDPADSVISITLQGQVSTLVTEEPNTQDAFTVGLWHFDEADGVGTVTDASGNNLHGQLNGNPARQNSNRPGYGRQIVFDKTNDWVRIPASPLMNFYDTPFTAELWFSMASKPTTSYVLARRGNDVSQQFELALGSGEVGLVGRVWDHNGNAHTLTSGSIDNFNLNQWYHAAVSCDRDTMKLFLNGVLMGKSAVSGGLRFQATEPLAIGANSFGTQVFHGVIDEVRLSNIAREPWEFHVTRSRLEVSLPILQFGNVLIDQTRTVPVAVSNVGSQPLLIIGIASTNAHVTVTPFQTFTLLAGHTDTLHVTFAPVAEEILTENSTLIIESNDPTYPSYILPLRGAGVNTLPAGPYKTDPLTLGLWHLNETAGTAAFDSSGNAMNGTLSGGVSHELETRKFEAGAALRFDGQTGIVTAKPPSGVRVAPTWGGVTAEAWVNLRGLPLGKGTLLKRGSGGFSQFHLFIDSTATLVGRVFNSAQTAFSVTSKSMGTLKVRQWYHAALVAGQDSVTLYINGDRKDAVAFKGPLAGSQTSTVMDTLSVLAGSNWERTTPLYGTLDEIRLSSVARQPWEFNVNLARIELSVSNLAFGQVLLGEERTFSLWVRNPGIDALEVSSVSTSAPSSFQIDTTHFSVPAGGIQLVRVTFRPLASGTQNAQLLFRSNDPFWPLKTVPLQGEGLTERSFTPYRSDGFTLALFHFDEKTTTSKVVSDSSSTGLKGTLEGNAALSDTARYGRAVRLSAGSVRIPPNAALDFTHGDFTVEFWFAMNKPVRSRVVLFKQDSTEAVTFDIALDTTKNAGVVARFKDSTGEIRSLKTGGMKGLHVQQWYHVALSYGGGKLRLFLNGLPSDSLAFAGAFRSFLSTDIRLGTGFAGRIDEFRVSGVQRADWEYNVVPPVIAVNPTSLNFATVLVQESRIIQIWVKNQGDQDLVVRARHGVSAGFSIPDSVKAMTLSRMQTRMIPVTYRPMQADVTDRDTITVTSNDPVSATLLILLEGSSTEAKGKTEYASDSHTLALFHLNSSVDDTAYDASGRNHHGILNGDAGWVTTGFFGNAVSLNGTTDFVRVPASPEIVFDYAKQSFTIECYFRTDTLAQTLISSGYTDSSRIANYGIAIDSEGRLTVPYFGSGGGRVNDGAWHHAAFAYNYLDANGTGRLYLDGNLVWSKPLKTTPAVDPGRPLFLGAEETRVAAADTNGTTGTFHGMLDEVRLSDIVREPWEFQLPDFGIRVQQTDPETLQVGKPLVLRVSVPASLNAVKVVFRYRSGGQTSYRSANAEPSNNSTYKVLLPAEAVTLQGLEYYFEIQNATETLTTPGLDPVNNPFSMSVGTAGVQSPIPFQIRQFQMFSVPLQLDTTTVAGVLEDDFGPYDPYQWRLFWWYRREYRYVAYNATDTTRIFFDFKPGRAYWLVSSTNRTFDTGRGMTVSLDSMVSVPVDTGWNMIGNPFNFPVRWQDCSLSSDSVTTPYAYESESGSSVPDQAVLEPWKGYWIYNWGASEANLFVPPKSHGMSKTGRARAGLAESLTKGEWLIQLSAGTKTRRDSYNFAGVKNGARPGFDPFDRPDPPAVEAGVALAFDHADWKGHSGSYAADIRGAGERGHAWRFRVESRNPGEDITLTWKFLQTLPEGWNAYLFDLEEGTSLKMTETKDKHFTPGKAASGARLFKLVAGSKEFIEGESEGIPLEPVAFRLFQNYPNPFNPETAIHYSIPKNGHATLTVYNALGQKVRTLLDSEQKTGAHEVLWNGRDDSGLSVPSGVYIYRLKTQESAATRKMILIK
jgi:hypothetical protein